MPQSYGGLRLQVGKLRHGVPGLPPALLCRVLSCAQGRDIKAPVQQ